MSVWVMDGVQQGWYMTICPRKESLATLESLRREARFENSITLARLPAQLLVHHNVVMAAILSECCCMFVWVMDGVQQGWYMTICPRKESLATLESLRREARFENSTTLASLPGQILVCHNVVMDCH